MRFPPKPAAPPDDGPTVPLRGVELFDAGGVLPLRFAALARDASRPVRADADAEPLAPRVTSCEERFLVGVFVDAVDVPPPARAARRARDEEPTVHSNDTKHYQMLRESD